VQHLAQPVVARKPGVLQRLIEARDCSTIHLLVNAVTAVHPHDRGLVAVLRRERCRPAERLRPVRGETLAVIGVKAVAERVAHQLVSHDPGMPSQG
jgi:ubiquinone biosynthesis protein UbiJ